MSDERPAVAAELADGVLRLTIDREDRRNALSGDVVRELRDGIARASSDDDARVVVLTGAGDKAFCAGADLGGMVAGTEVTQVEIHEARGNVRELLLEMRACPRPIIARVQGLALAGGLGLMLASDLVVAAETAQFGTPEVNVGVWPFMIGALVARHVSAKRALDLFMTGRRIDAATAYDWGLVSRVVPTAQLDAAVDELAGEIAGKSPLVLRMGKAAYYATEDVALAPALGYLQAQLALLAQSRDAAEGVQAFFEKRPPRWTGR